ncbi:unnamed protein product [Leptosia nina]|uniref:Uncharacterized protein n=1 Tax=Leptosia nina TaxID=320188 RepID=A0AAV1JIS3_9NEOP
MFQVGPETESWNTWLLSGTYLGRQAVMLLSRTHFKQYYIPSRSLTPWLPWISVLYCRSRKLKFCPGIERAGPPFARAVHEGMFYDPSNKPGSRTQNWEPSQTLMRGRIAHAHCESSITLALTEKREPFGDVIRRVKRR